MRTGSYPVLAVVMTALCLMIGCGNPPQPEIRQLDKPEIRTLGLDANDYNQLTERLSRSILTDRSLRLDSSMVLSLGPIDTERCVYDFDARRLQEKLQTAIVRSGKIKVNYAVDAMAASDAARARYSIMLLQWEKESTVDPEDLRTFGSLAKVDYLLFGRLSCQTTRKGSLTEVTYTFNWKIGDCESGLLVWADDQELVKQGPSR